jgi:hypothetical protein
MGQLDNPMKIRTLKLEIARLRTLESQKRSGASSAKTPVEAKTAVPEGSSDVPKKVRTSRREASKEPKGKGIAKAKASARAGKAGK